MTKNRPPVLAHLRFQERAAELGGLDRQALFTEIWQSNLWGADSSRSGLGSELEATAALRAGLPSLFRQLGIRRLLDLPCGDFSWFSTMAGELEEYIGGDIVAALIQRNAARFATPDGNLRFCHLDLLGDALPKMDAVLCRDCLVHLSNNNIARALANLRRSGSEYLIATTFTECDANLDIEDGDWRMLNLELAPFHLPPPVAVLSEACTEAGGAYADKSLGIWRLQDGALSESGR